jgi:hypothetical protein
MATDDDDNKQQQQGQDCGVTNVIGEAATTLAK